MSNSYFLRPPLLLMAMMALLLAAWAGLLRLGWELPLLRPALPMAHGPLMIGGFLGTLIGLERGVALNRTWGFAGPALTAVGALSLLVFQQSTVGVWLITAGSGLLLLVFAVLARRQMALFTAILGLGALSWLVGNLLWLGGRPLFLIVPWWIGFLVLTIAGERLELNRVLRLNNLSHSLFVTAVALLSLGLALTLLRLDAGIRLAGIGLLALAGWLIYYDIARRTIRQTGVTRYMGICLLSGYFWLALAGVLALIYGGVSAGPIYDAFLHSIFVGFILAMIFGHAPIIFPAILNQPITFHASFYAPLILLHLSLGLRVSGDLTGWLPARQWGGMLNVLVILLFIVNMAVARRRGARGGGRSL
jgi:hypothetical protein